MIFLCLFLRRLDTQISLFRKHMVQPFPELHGTLFEAATLGSDPASTPSSTVVKQNSFVFMSVFLHFLISLSSFLWSPWKKRQDSTTARADKTTCKPSQNNANSALFCDGLRVVLSARALSLAVSSKRVAPSEVVLTVLIQALSGGFVRYVFA